MVKLEGRDPQEIGPYRVLGGLGSGGMGRVFLARSPGGRYVAVKVVRPELAEQADFRIRFAREVAAAQKVSGLFTATVVDADVDAPVPWVATAYVAGPSLADADIRHGPLPAPSVLALAAGLAEGLGAIHSAGIVHRDLKPSNVLLAEDGPRVIDFGISRAAEESTLTGTGLVIGSPGFMSPEQARGHAVGPASDVFSLGAVLTFAATGEGPFGSGSTAVLLLYRVVFEPPATQALPAELRPPIERCLAKDPRQRPGTRQLLAELNAHPAMGWLPAPIAQSFPRPLAGTVTADDRSAGPVTEPAAPGRPLSAGASGSPSTITTSSSWSPDATAGRFTPAGNGQRPPRGRRRRLAWALVSVVLLAAAATAAVALASLGAHHPQPAAEETQATSSPAVTVPGTRQAATAGIPSSVRAPSLPGTPSAARASSPSGISPTVPSGVFWTAAVLSSHYQQHAQAMVERLQQSGFDGGYWWSTAANSVLPGYWVVTSGDFPDQADANARAGALQAAGFTGAYPRCVGSRQACASSR